jgi:hypothetical protein
MKRLFVAAAGLVMVLGLLVPAALSYDTSNGASGDTGTAIQSGSQNPVTMPSDNGTSQQNDPFAYQRNDPNANWTNGLPGQPADVSTEPSGQPLRGPYGTVCMGMGGKVC